MFFYKKGVKKGEEKLNIDKVESYHCTVILKNFDIKE